jgi:starvation-inducible DNA-binding protein
MAPVSVWVFHKSVAAVLASNSMHGEHAQAVHFGRPDGPPRPRSLTMPNHVHEKETKAARLQVPDGFSPENVKNLSSVLNALLADAFALYLKTKNFHWHMSGQHFRDYHLLLDEQATQIFAITDDIAERVRKVGGTTLHSIGHISRLQRIADNDEEFVGHT